MSISEHNNVKCYDIFLVDFALNEIITYKKKTPYSLHDTLLCV